MIKLKPLQNQQAFSLSALGNGVECTTMLGGELVNLSIKLAKHPYEKTTYTTLNSPILGLFAMVNPSQFLSFCSSVPVLVPASPEITLAADDHGELIPSHVTSDSLADGLRMNPVTHATHDGNVKQSQDLYWALTLKNVVDVVAELFGDLSAGVFNARALSHYACVTVELQRAGAHLLTSIYVDPAKLVAAIDRNKWRPIVQTISPDFVVRSAVTLGYGKVSAATFKKLMVGDIVVPSHQLCTIHGQGQISLGGATIRGQFLCDHNAVKFSVEQVELGSADFAVGNNDHEMTIYGNTMGNDMEHAADGNNEALVNDLKLALTIESGEVMLTIGQIRALTAGSVLQVQGVRPGEACLRYNDKIVAVGELVDIEGQLGFQVTSMEML